MKAYISTIFFSFFLITTPLVHGGEQQVLNELRQFSKGFAALAKEVTPPVVFIEIEGVVEEEGGTPFGPQGPGGMNEFFGDEFFRRFFGLPPGGGGPMAPRRRPIQGAGSGVLVTPDGYILTNNHIVRHADQIAVHLQDGRTFDAKVIGTDPQTDIAVVKIDVKDPLPYLHLGNSDELEVGEFVMAVGSPFGLEASVTVGVISAKGRNELHITDFEDFIQTDAAINPGNSGGPLVNLDGEVIGINTAIASAGGGSLGIGFAIPSKMAKHVMDQLIQQGSVTRGFVGINPQTVDQDLADAFGLERPTGALIAEVVEDSPAAEAGLQQGDIILEMDGQPVESVSGLRNTISLMEPGTLTTFTINRDGEILNRRLKVGTRPTEVSQPGSMAFKLGLQVEPLTETIRNQTGLMTESGVVIREVDPNSPAARKGLKKGDLIMRVNRTPVASPEEFHQALADAAKSSNHVLLLVRQGPRMLFVTLKIKE